MRYLLISFCFVFIACGSFSQKQNFERLENSTTNIQNLYFSNPDTDYIYKAYITIYGSNFGGIFIVKKLGELNHRIVFTTEMGNKLFDFSFINNTFKVNYILENLNKKTLINVLKKDFEVLIKEKLKPTNTFKTSNETIFETQLNKKSYYYYYEDNKLNKVARIGKGKAKIIFLFSEINNNIANQIKISHSNIKLEINLKSIIK